MSLLIRKVPVKIFSTSKNATSIRTMSAASANFLVNDPKYSFLKDLGLQEHNPGVFDGSWKGSGKVRQLIDYISNY